jgi:cation diffusion facilitator CzcD-associated flavoprotein CzcO
MPVHHASPEIRGVDTYLGHPIHAGTWDHDHDHDFTGERVGVICTGAGAVRIVPELVDSAAFVKVFQHNPSWVLPRLAVPIPAAVRALCPDRVVTRLGKAHLRRQVRDPWLRRQLTPTGSCTQTSISSDYYPALQRANCKLIDWPIATLSPVGIRTSDGVEHHLDAIVFAVT